MSKPLKMDWSHQVSIFDGANQAFARGFRRVLLVSPTGSGKTAVLLRWALDQVAAGHLTVIVVNTLALLIQLKDELDSMGLQGEYGVIQGNHEETRSARLQLATFQTLSKPARLSRWQFPRIVIDEAHHAATDSYKRILDASLDAHVLGMTATPTRKGPIPLSAAGFEKLVQGPGVAELIRAGILCRFEHWVPSTLDLSQLEVGANGDFTEAEIRAKIDLKTLSGNVVKTYTEHVPGARAVVFCTDIKAAEDMALAFQFHGGIRAMAITQNTPKKVVTEQLRRFKAEHPDSHQVLCVVNILSEGVNLPNIDAIFLARPTLSLVLYSQMIGRGLRRCIAKPDKVLQIFDHTQCYTLHRAPDVERKWELDHFVVSPEADAADAARWRCAGCGRINADRDAPCVSCGEGYRSGAGVREGGGVGGRKIQWLDGVPLVKVGEEEFPELCGPNTQGRWSVNFKKEKIDLGFDEATAHAHYAKGIKRWKANGRVLPETAAELREWLDRSKAYTFSRGAFPRLRGPNRVGRWHVSFKGKPIDIGGDEGRARAHHAKAAARYEAAGRVLPETEAELREWLDRPKCGTVFPELKGPSKCRSFYVCFRKETISLGVDEGTARALHAKAAARYEAAGRVMPETASKLREWLDRPKRGTCFPELYRREGGGAFYLLFRKERISFGSDETTARARYAQGKARWEAEGWVLPETAAEFREWLGLPPRKQKRRKLPGKDAT